VVGLLKVSDHTVGMRRQNQHSGPQQDCLLKSISKIKYEKIEHGAPSRQSPGNDMDDTAGVFPTQFPIFQKIKFDHNFLSGTAKLGKNDIGLPSIHPTPK
jgi:hypothetical protein